VRFQLRIALHLIAGAGVRGMLLYMLLKNFVPHTSKRL
jgi:hypothetical protein